MSLNMNGQIGNIIDINKGERIVATYNCGSYVKSIEFDRLNNSFTKLETTNNVWEALHLDLPDIIAFRELSHCFQLNLINIHISQGIESEIDAFLSQLMNCSANFYEEFQEFPLETDKIRKNNGNCGCNKF